MTETFMSISPPPSMKEPNGSVGRPCPGVQVKIVNNEGSELGKEQIGKLIVKSACCTTLGYLKADKATSETIKDGW
jgi:long-subunit acyl-CoA synthetase (AMP-forming)